MSNETARSETRGLGIDKAPDFTLSHILSFELPVPSRQDPLEIHLHYSNRAGMKIFHRCSVLFAEMKSTLHRFMSTPRVAASLLLVAQEQVMEYCAAYFEANSEAGSVIAFVAAGAAWRWAVFERAETPKFDWADVAEGRTKSAMLEFGEKNLQKADAFAAKFGHVFFKLCTSESDAELTQIRSHIYNVIHQKGHICTPRPPIPTA